MPDPQTRLKALTDRLREQGYRLTPQRVAVLRILAASKGHPSVEQIYDQIKVQFPTTSLATVYKLVALLREMGEVLQLGFPNASNRYDGNNPSPHPHLICTMCGEIRDLDLPALSGMIQQASQDLDYRGVSHRLDFYGICSRCQVGIPQTSPHG